MLMTTDACKMILSALSVSILVMSLTAISAIAESETQNSAVPPASAEQQNEQQQQQLKFEARNKAARLCNESLPLIKEGNYQLAESKLLESLQLDPDNASTLSNYGLTLLKTGRLADARQQLEKSVKLDPKLTSALLNLGLAYEASGDLNSAKTYLLKFIDTSTNKEQIDVIRDRVIVIDKAIASGVPAVAPSADDYFAQIPRNKMFPWPKNLMPLKIYVAPAAGVPGYKPSFGDDLDSAIAAWSKALDGIVSFQKTDKRESADIDIHWTNDASTALMKAERGDCKYIANGAGMKHADILLLTGDGAVSDKLNDAKVTWVAMHELGHALGVNAHSNNPTDVMYFAAPVKDGMPSLSARDVKTFKRLYTEKLADTWLTLNEDAINLIHSNKNKEALAKLQQAYKIDASQKVIRENMALVELKIGNDLLTTNKFTEAEPYLVHGLELEKDLKDENFDDLLSDYAEVLRNTGRAGDISSMYQRYGKSAPKS